MATLFCWLDSLSGNSIKIVLYKSEKDLVKYDSYHVNNVILRYSLSQKNVIVSCINLLPNIWTFHNRDKTKYFHNTNLSH